MSKPFELTSRTEMCAPCSANDRVIPSPMPDAPPISLRPCQLPTSCVLGMTGTQKLTSNNYASFLSGHVRLEMVNLRVLPTKGKDLQGQSFLELSVARPSEDSHITTTSTIEAYIDFMSPHQSWTTEAHTVSLRNCPTEAHGDSPCGALSLAVFLPRLSHLLEPDTTMHQLPKVNAPCSDMFRPRLMWLPACARTSGGPIHIESNYRIVYQSEVPMIPVSEPEVPSLIGRIPPD